MSHTEYQHRRQILIDYLKVKVAESDWHGVSDAANDLRVMEAQQRALVSQPLIKVPNPPM